MSAANELISQATRIRAARVFDSVTGRIEAALGSAWLPGSGKQLLDEVRAFCQNNRADIGQRPFVLKLHGGAEPVSDTLLTPQFIADSAKAVGGPPLIEVAVGLHVLDIASLDVSVGDLRNAVTDASDGCAIFFFENDRLCSIWAGKQRITEMVPSTWLSAGAASNRNWEAREFIEAIHEHYRRVVKYGQNLNHWHDEDNRVLKKADPPKHGTTEEIFHGSLFWWLQEHLPPHSVTVKDAEKGRGDSPDIIVVDFNCFYVVEVKWLGTNGSSSYTWAAIKHAIRQGHRYGARPPFPEATSLVFYDGRTNEVFGKLGDHLIEEGIAEFGEFEEEQMPTNGVCYVFYLHSGSASKNAKKKK